jgi:DNA-binding response OmpR family regulator
MTQPEQNPLLPRLCVIGEADPYLANLLQRFAQKAGLRIRRAKTGDALLEIANRETPALVILDPDLPGKRRGWQAAQALGKNHVPLIVCTWLSAAEAGQLIGIEFTYLQKPDIHFRTFAAALQKAGVISPPAAA